MKNIVSFETAKRLKDAGFPQPYFSIRQTWYTYLYPEIWEDGTEFYIANTDQMRFITISDAKLATTGVQDSNRQGEIYGGSVVFAPAATDILHELDKNTEEAFWWALIPLSNSTWKWVLQQRKEADPVSILDFFNDNPAEAAAAAWLHLNENK